MGDLNWNLDEKSSHGQEYENSIAEIYELTQHIKIPTRITAGRTSLLDIVMSNVGNINYSGCIDYVISDHYPIYVIKKRITVKRLKERIDGRPLGSLNWEFFQEKLVEYDWENILSAGNLDDIWSGVKSAITEILNNLCPLKWMSVISNKPSWFNSELTDIAKQRDRLFQIYRRSNCTRNNIFNEAVLKRQEFNRLSKIARENFYRDQLMFYKNDQKRFWKKVSELLGSNTSAPVENVFRHGTDILLNMEDRVEEINQFFAMVGERVAREIPYKPCILLDHEVLKQRLDHFTPLSIDGFLKIVSELKMLKSSGINGLNSRVIIKAMKTIPEVFVFMCKNHLVRESFR